MTVYYVVGQTRFGGEAFDLNFSGKYYGEDIRKEVIKEVQERLYLLFTECLATNSESVLRELVAETLKQAVKDNHTVKKAVDDLKKAVVNGQDRTKVVEELEKLGLWLMAKKTTDYTIFTEEYTEKGLWTEFGILEEWFY